MSKTDVAATYKALDVEESIDIFFYRPLGYRVARVCQKLGITPNAVTIISIFIGVAGGRLFYYRDFSLNCCGVILWVIADTLDSADGQLARMTNHKSKIGRILDGLGGNIMFVSFYLHLFARMINTYPGVWWLWLFLFVLAGGISHSLQSSLADYYRNAYLKFVVDQKKSELDGAAEVRRDYLSVRFSEHPVKKILLRAYLNYTTQQEALSRNFQKLKRRAVELFGADIPGWFSDEYRLLNKPLMKYYAILTTNTRMIVMAAAVLIDFVPLYFLTEVVVINLIMVAVTLRQEKISAGLLALIDRKTNATLEPARP
jgi:hypothetical protein